MRYVSLSSPPNACNPGRGTLPQWTFGPPSIVIFFSLTEAPLPDPTRHPETDPKRTRKGAEKEPKRSQPEPNGAETEPNGAEMDRNSAFRGGTGGGVCQGRGGWGGL